MTDIALSVSQLSCERDDRCLFSDLSMEVRFGDVIQIEGPNGSGKTTLLKVLALLSPDYSGSIAWRGAPILSAKHQYLAELLYLGHLSGVKEALSPRQNLEWYQGVFGRRPHTSVKEALSAVGLRGYEDVPCAHLSAGQNRRVSLARLILSRASLWVLDEPFTAIDKKGVSELEAMIEAHCHKGGAVILTTHQDLQLSSVKIIDLRDYKSSSNGSPIGQDEYA